MTNMKQLKVSMQYQKGLLCVLVWLIFFVLTNWENMMVKKFEICKADSVERL